MPAIPDGGTVLVPLHKSLRVTLSGAPTGSPSPPLDGVDFSLIGDGEPVVRIEPTEDETEVTLHPLRVGSQVLRATADGDAGPGTLPLGWTCTVTVLDQVAVALEVTLEVPGEAPLRLAQLGFEVSVPLNLGGRLVVRAIGKTGGEVPLQGQAWQSGQEAHLTVTPDPDNASVGILGPVDVWPFISISFVAQPDPDDPGSNIALGGVVSVIDAAATAIVAVGVLE